MPDCRRARSLLIASLAIGSAGALRAPLRPTRRRAVLAAGVAAAGTLRALRADALDLETKDIGTTVSSKLLNAPAEGTDALADVNWAAPKATGLSTDEMARRIDAGLRRECWFVTGRTRPELFSTSFRFSDPQVLHQHDHHPRRRLLPPRPTRPWPPTLLLRCR